VYLECFQKPFLPNSEDAVVFLASFTFQKYMLLCTYPFYFKRYGKMKFLPK
jgi:hypothetical protein